MEQLNLALVKTTNYDLKPFGKFKIKCDFIVYKKKPNYLEFNTLSYNTSEGMPYTQEQYENIVKFMQKHKTDILVDSNNKYYTIIGDVLVQVRHKKIYLYELFLSQRNVHDYEDMNELWNEFIGKS